MKHLLIIASLLLANTNLCLAQGINFKHCSYHEVLQLAQKEKKMLFLDFYTDWCGPCKKLSATTFLNEEVGKYFNKNFISLKLDAEKEGREVALQFKVSRYPTLLFLTADEKIAGKSTGYKLPDALLEIAQNAKESLGEEYSYTDLKKQYESKKNNEDFLNTYIEKALDMGELPVQAVDQWLRVQQSIEEDSRDMYEFLVQHIRLVYFGDKAGQIFEQNKAAYLALFPDSPGKIELLERQIAYNTPKVARLLQRPDLMRAFINKSQEMQTNSSRPPLISDYTRAELDYLIMAKDIEGYKAAAKAYVDSLQQIYSIKEIKAHDEKSFQKAFPSDVDFNSLSAREQRSYRIMKDGIRAKRIADPILEQGEIYLKHCENKADYKQLNKWIDYCYELSPELYRIDLLKGEALCQQGNTKEAVKMMEKALPKITSEKQQARIKSRIADMEAGK